jgi:RNA polymerase sigma-70 factor (ECF subfamily)
LQEIGGMNRYHPYHLARADMLRRLGEMIAAREAYKQALSLCQNQLERAHIQRKMQALG